MGTYAKYGGVGGGGGGGSGTVTSVGLADGSTIPIFNISGSPVTTSGTLTETLKTQTANKVFAGPTTGSAAQPTFRSLVTADLPFALGNLTDAGTDGIVIGNGTGAVVGSGTTIAQHVADTTHNGYLSSTDWNTFNSKFNLPSLTAGSVLFSDGTTIAQSNADFFWDNSAKRLGIGTNAPTLDVDIVNPTGDAAMRISAASGTFAQFQVQSGAVNPWIIGTQDNFHGNSLLFRYNFGAQLTVNPNGNVGLQDLDPDAQLVLGGAGLAVTDNYGLRIDDKTAGSNNWAIKTGLGLVEFGDDVSAANLSGTNTGDVTLGTANGLGIAAGQILSLGLSSTSTTGALSSTDWNTFNGKLSTSLTSAHILVGNGSNIATNVAMSGDIAITNAGVTSYSGTVPVTKGGTGLTTLTANNVILGNGTSNPAFVAPSTSGNVLTSNGTTWTSTAPSPAAITSEIVYTTPNGFGSTNTFVRYFTSLQINNGGADITATSGSTTGTFFTINTTGTYAVTWSGEGSGVASGRQMSIQLNPSNLTTDQTTAITSIGTGFTPGGNGISGGATCVRRFTAGDIIYPMVDVTSLWGTASVSKIAIVRVN